LATCFASLNHPQAISYNKVKVHSASVRTVISNNTLANRI